MKAEHKRGNAPVDRRARLVNGQYLKKAHNLDVKVIIDFAPNHTSPADPADPGYAENGRLYDDGTLLGGYTNDTADLFHGIMGGN